MDTKNFKNLCDRLLKKYGFKLISMPYSMKEDELVFPYEDFDDFEYKSFYDYLASKDFISEIAKKYQKSEDEINAAIKLSSDFGTYSDWHKDLYGYRPRNCFI